MGWWDWIRRKPRLPRDATLVAAEAADLESAGPWLDRFPSDLGPVIRAAVDAPGAAPADIVLTGSERSIRATLANLGPRRLLLLGRASERFDLPDLAGCPSAWVNARHAQTTTAGCKLVATASEAISAHIPGSEPLGDPVPQVSPGALPKPAQPAICERLAAHRRAGRWIGYFAATGEDEEPLAYSCFFRLVRHGMGLMVLGPAEPERAEPVYREALKYRLPTNRHKRLSTSHADIKTRVYFLEEAAAIHDMYACADFAVVGGTLHPAAANRSDLLSPAISGCPMIVGPARRHQPLVNSALNAGAVWPATDEAAIVGQARRLLTNPGERGALVETARAWAERLPGASARVLQRLHDL